MGAENEKMKELADNRLTWILGSSRSGSTWLLRMLSDTGEVAPIDDPHLGHHLGVWRPISIAYATAREAPELTTLTAVKREKQSYFLSDRYEDAWRPALRDLIAARFGAEAAESPAARRRPDPPIVVKEPASQVAELLLSLFPRSNLIFLLRDGRDVVDSWLDAYQRGSWAQEEGAFDAAPWGRKALIAWLARVWLYRTEAVQRAYAAHDPSRRVLVRYEDLLADPRAELGRIMTMLGLVAHGATLERIADTNEFTAVSPAERGGGKAVRMARPGGWRENLNASEQAALLEVVGPRLTELGYGPERGAGRPPSIAA